MSGFERLRDKYQAEADMRLFLDDATGDIRARALVWMTFHGARLSTTHRNKA